MALIAHGAELLRGYECAKNGCTREQLHIHVRDRSSGEVLTVGTGGLPAYSFGNHVVVCEPSELADFELKPTGELEDLAAPKPEPEP